MDFHHCPENRAWCSIFNIQNLSINLMCLVIMRQSSWLWSILDGMSRTKNIFKMHLIHYKKQIWYLFLLLISWQSEYNFLIWLKLASTFANEKNNLFLVRIFWTTYALGYCQFMLLLLCLDFNGNTSKIISLLIMFTAEF